MEPSLLSKAIRASTEASLARLKRERLEREISLLNVMYAESVKNREIAEFSLKNKTPFIKPIDLPFAPLKIIGVNWPLNLAYGLIFGLVLGVGFVVGRRIFRQIMQ